MTLIVPWVLVVVLVYALSWALTEPRRLKKTLGVERARCVLLHEELQRALADNYTLARERTEAQASIKRLEAEKLRAKPFTLPAMPTDFDVIERLNGHELEQGKDLSDGI